MSFIIGTLLLFIIIVIDNNVYLQFNAHLYKYTKSYILFSFCHKLKKKLDEEERRNYLLVSLGNNEGLHVDTLSKNLFDLTSVKLM